MREYLFTEELLAKSFEGNQSAQHEIYGKIRKVMLPVAQRYIDDEIIVDEMIQESIIKIFKRLNVIHYKALVAYSKRTINNKCIDWLRTNASKVRKTISLDASLKGLTNENEKPIQSYNMDVQKGYDPDVVWEKLYAAIEDLSPAYQKVFKMHYLDGMMVADIANELGTHKGSTKSNLHKARANMRKKLGSYDEVLS